MYGQGGCLVEVKIGYPALGDAMGRRSPESWFESGVNPFDNVCPSFFRGQHLLDCENGSVRATHVALFWRRLSVTDLRRRPHVFLSISSSFVPDMAESEDCGPALPPPCGTMHHQHATLL
jgi:hypothetical protein